MPKYYCDYCDTYLTHDSPSVRKTHCNGRKHKENVKFYYQKWMEQQAQSLIDATIFKMFQLRKIKTLAKFVLRYKLVEIVYPSVTPTQITTQSLNVLAVNSLIP
ncbi:u1 small nuclear ribonucleoprotein C [Caerostris darwini]|uniref:U1 small nuclear ribonucleoprotein C n=1 Tax=Caerostris darwini TaxID=1538125 RepID=A0AAV4QXA5_9ARAC|nr:u1 small nuclear ribonucleoprotein C [Caerostris darwini]